MFTIVPSTVWTRVPQPTAQYGHTLGTTLASLMQSAWARATAGLRSTPRPARPPTAVPAAALADNRKKSRRVTSMALSSAPRRPGPGQLSHRDRIRRPDHTTTRHPPGANPPARSRPDRSRRCPSAPPDAGAIEVRRRSGGGRRLRVERVAAVEVERAVADVAAHGDVELLG